MAHLSALHYAGSHRTRILAMVLFHQPVSIPQRMKAWYSTSNHASHRPTGGIAGVILFIFLNLNPHKSRPIREQAAELDLIGLFAFVVGVVCLLIGFEFSETGCKHLLFILQAKT